jgi:hypothetical protein
MLSTLYRVAVIILLCLFSSACCLWGWGCKKPEPPGWPKPKPDWAINKLPTDGEGAVMCDGSYADTSQQKDKATRVALTELAMQKGIHVIGEFEMKGTESGAIATFETKQGVDVTIKAETYDYWEHPAKTETCVWLKEMK